MEVHSWSQFVDALLVRKVAFLTAFFAVFLSSYAILSWLDFLPELILPAEAPVTETRVSESQVNEVISEVESSEAQPLPEVLPVSPVYTLT